MDTTLFQFSRGMFVQLHLSENATRAQNPFLRVANPPDAATAAGLRRLKAAFADPAVDPAGGDAFARLVLCWHGSKAANLLKICECGPRSLRTTDAGFYGTGSYFALEGQYASRYSQLGGANAAGEFGMILYAVSVAQTHVVTVAGDYRDASEEDAISPLLHGFSRFYSGDAKHAVALAPKCDSHFIPVKYYGYTHPRTGGPVPSDVDFQAVSEDSGQAEGHELVIGSHYRCTPLALVYFTV
jgi:hypothetical protein